jgi:hypothetical protein
MRNIADVTGGKPTAVQSQSISGVCAINPLVAFHDIHGKRERCYSFILSRTPHEIPPLTPLSGIRAGKRKIYSPYYQCRRNTYWK